MGLIVTEPTSTTTAGVIAAGMGIASLMPSIDANALVGAFAGSTLFVVSAKDTPFWQRVVFLGIGIVMGYLGAPELMRMGPIQSSGLAAFFCAAVIVTVTLKLIEKCRGMDFKWFRGGGSSDG